MTEKPRKVIKTACKRFDHVFTKHIKLHM